MHNATYTKKLNIVKNISIVMTRVTARVNDEIKKKKGYKMNKKILCLV